jgi:bacterioferritin (cytochrome b1)
MGRRCEFCSLNKVIPNGVRIVLKGVMEILVDRETLLIELKKILIFENGHMGIYDSLTRSIDDRRAIKFFHRFKRMEQEHIERISLFIQELGGEPNILYGLSSDVASFLGSVISVGGLTNVLKAALYMENMAIRGYVEVINLVKDQAQLADRMRENQLDAELMALWLQRELEDRGIDVTSEKADFQI